MNRRNQNPLTVTGGYTYTIKTAANETADNILASHTYIR